MKTRRRPTVTPHLAELYRAIYGVIRRVPKGRVATYGQIAELAGLPGGARVSAASLKVNGDKSLPWWRICGKAGPRRARIAILDPVGAAIQRDLLEQEGVPVGDKGLISLDVYGWIPRESPRRPAAPKRRRPKT